MKSLIFSLTFLFALTGFAADLEINDLDRSILGTLERIESQKNAKCDYERSTMRISNMMFSWHKRYYSCIGNEGDFRISLRVREQAQYPIAPNGPGYRIVYGNPVVTKIITYKN